MQYTPFTQDLRGLSQYAWWCREVGSQHNAEQSIDGCFTTQSAIQARFSEKVKVNHIQGINAFLPATMKYPPPPRTPAVAFTITS